MADIQSNIKVDIDTSSALASIKNLQRQISAFQKQMQSGSAANAAQAQNLQKILINDINATGKFAARMQTIRSTTESFTTSLEKNKLSMGEYFKYGIASSQKFGSVFTKEFNTIEKVARERVKTLQTQYISLGRDANGALKSIAVRPLALDMNDLGTKTAMAAQKQQIMNQLLKQGSTNLLNFGKNTQWAGRQLMVGFTIPLSILGSTASKVFMELEEQAIRFKRVYGELFTPPEEADAMIESLRTLGEEFTKYGVAVKDTLGLAADAAAMGKTGVELTDQVTQATRLAVLGSVSQQQALETSISLTNAFGTATQDLGNKIDFLNAVENQTVVSIEDLTIAIPKAGPVIQQLGGDVEDLAFFLTAMKEGGINASEGANALKSGLASLINPTAEASSMLAAFGINVRGIIESNRGNIQGTVVEFAKALDTLDPLNRARAIEQMFGKFQFARVSTLFKNVVAEGTQASRVLELANSTTSQLAALSQKELSAVEESTTYKFKGAIEEFKNALAPIGEEFMKLVTPVIEFGTRVLKAFDNMSDGAKGFLTGMVAIAGGLAPVFIMTFGLLANAAANALKGFQIIRNGFGALTGQSKILGEQTQYMTQEQLEANAVAASLEQSHLDLSQIFTSEASAVMRLKDAYEKATQAGSRFATMPISTTIGRGAAVKAKGYANGGVIKGPGSGTSDSIPAMVSNGEAIIPAEETKKYAPLIQGIISDNIPGFAKGRVGSGSAGRIGKSLMTMPISYKSNVSNQSGALSIADIVADQSSLAYLYSDQILKQAGTSASAVSKEIMLWERKNQEAIRAATDAVNSGTPASQAFADLSQKFVKDMASAEGPTKKFSDTARSMFPALEKDLKIAQAKAKELGLNLRKGADTAKLASALPDNALAQGINTPGNFGRLSRTRGAASTIFSGGSKNYDTSGVPAFMLAKGISTSSPAYGSMMSQEHIATTKEQEAARLAHSTTRKIVQSVHNEAVKGINEAAKSASPSKKAKQAGKNIADGAIQGIEEAGKKAKPAARRAFTDGPTTIGDSQSARWERTVNPRAVAADRLGNIRAQKTVEALGSATGKLQGFSFALSSVAGIATMFGGEIGEVGNVIFQLSGALFALATVTNLLTTAKMKERAATAISALGEGATKGKIFSGGFKNSLGNLGKVVKAVAGGFMRFLPVIGALVTAFAAFKIISGIIESQRKKIEGLGEAASLSGDKLTELGTLLGTEINQVTYGQGVSAAGAMSGAEQKKTQEIIQGEEFKKLFETQIIGLSSATAEQAKASLNSMFLQLVSSGVDQQIVSQIIQQLANEAGKSTLDIRFASVDIDPKSINASVADLSAKATDLLSGTKGYISSGTMVNSSQTGGKAVALGKSAMSSGYKQQFEQTSAIFKTLFDTLRLNFDQGLLTADEFNGQVEDLFSKIGGLESAADLLPSIAEKMGLEDAISKIKNVQSQAIVLKAIIAGISKDDSRISAIENGSKKGATAEDRRNAALAIKSLTSATEGLATAQEKQRSTAQSLIEQEALNQQYLDAKKSIEDQILAINSQNEAYAILIANGWLAADAITAVSDANFMSAYSADPTKILELADAYRQLMNAQKTAVTSGGGSSAKQETPLEKAINNLKEQKTQLQESTQAYAKLRDAGLGVKESFDAAKDPVLAAALATTKVGTKAWSELVSRIKSVNAELSKGALADLLKTGKIEKELKQNQITVSRALSALGYSYEQVQNVLSNDELTNTLAKDLKDGSVNSKQLQQSLAQIKQMGQLDLELNLTTKQGVEEEFQKTYDEATSWLNAQKTELDINFKLENAEDIAKVIEAENAIAKLNFQIDDYEASLQGISEQEEVINKNYDDRESALSKIQKINDKIAKQQKSQLSIADALSQGDIAAAARAVQEAQAQRAQDAIDDQSVALQAARESELNRLVDKNGLSRTDIESKIKDLKKEIFDIEEDSLEPANERIRLATVEKDAQIASLDAQILKWEQLSNKIQLAKLTPEGYAELLAQAGTLSQMFLDWDAMKDKTITITVVENKTSSTTPTSTVSTMPSSTGSGVPSSSGPSAAISTQPLIPTGGSLSGNTIIAPITEAEKQVTKTVAQAVADLNKVIPTTTKAIAKATAAETKKLPISTPKVSGSGSSGGGGGGKGLMMLASGGVVPRYMARGGMFSSLGSDTVPSMLTPGEFVMRRPAVRNIGLGRLKAMNNGASLDSSVYNYSINLSVQSGANPDQIARAVMTQIKQIDSQRIRGSKF